MKFRGPSFVSEKLRDFPLRTQLMPPSGVLCAAATKPPGPQFTLHNCEPPPPAAPLWPLPPIFQPWWSQAAGCESNVTIHYAWQIHDRVRMLSAKKPPIVNPPPLNFFWAVWLGLGWGSFWYIFGFFW
uniref:Uncharacterized protein n=1 Tax=Eutreptiella gymnastica TaxID=73025 RepID=A0A7S4C952_9EUGL